jgi:hypothetical protein
MASTSCQISRESPRQDTCRTARALLASPAAQPRGDLELVPGRAQSAGRAFPQTSGSTGGPCRHQRTVRRPQAAERDRVVPRRCGSQPRFSSAPPIRPVPQSRTVRTGVARHSIWLRERHGPWRPVVVTLSPTALSMVIALPVLSLPGQSASASATTWRAALSSTSELRFA